MIEVNIKVTEINNTIGKLQSLQSRYSSIDITPPTTVGGGKTVNELENLAATYKMMNVYLRSLISNTISFLQNVRDSYVSSDEEAARKINNK